MNKCLFASAAVFVTLLTSGCGGDGSNASSGTVLPAPTPTPTPTATPTPSPTPTPAPTYQTLDQLTGNQTFQSAGVQYQIGTGISQITTFQFGSGVVGTYNASPDTLTLTAPGGSPSVTISSSTPTSRPSPQVAVWDLSNATDTIIVTLLGANAGYSFTSSYGTAAASPSNAPRTLRLSVAGVPTLASDMPRTGTVVYDFSVGGTVVNSSTATSANTSTGTLTMNFATGVGTFSIPLTAVGTNNSLGTLTGTVTIIPGTNAFTGTVQLSGITAATTTISGAFFGPQGIEIASAQVLADSTTLNAYAGSGTGTRRTTP